MGNMKLSMQFISNLMSALNDRQYFDRHDRSRKFDATIDSSIVMTNVSAKMVDSKMYMLEDELTSNISCVNKK